MFPPETQTRPDLDLRGLAKGFEISGGEIKNAALSAAFYCGLSSNRLNICLGKRDGLEISSPRCRNNYRLCCSHFRTSHLKEQLRAVECGAVGGLRGGVGADASSHRSRQVGGEKRIPEEWQGDD
jgi:hypothetical protein